MDRTRSLLVLGAVASLLVAASPVAAASPSSDGLSKALLRAALVGMAPEIRAIREAHFESDRYVVVAYARVSQPFDVATGRPVGPTRETTTDLLAPMAVTGITYLTIDISVEYERDAPCCYWDANSSFDWSDAPPYGGLGRDQIATAWANGQGDGIALDDDYAYGYYTGGSSIPMNRADMTPNVGVDWEFYECKNNQSCYSNSYANWGYLLATLHSNSRHFHLTNVVFKYFHDWSQLNYSVGFSGSGPSISISPTTSTQSTAVYTTFND